MKDQLTLNMQQTQKAESGFNPLDAFVMLRGDCLFCVKMANLPDGSVDAVVTDPPYELGFMGKKWDNSGIAYNVLVWKEMMRVLKPGGYLLSFGGTRTYHRMAVAIEDAGFEVRDMIEWVYGSGFPKSLNIGKAVDKTGGVSVGWFGKWLREWRTKEGLSSNDIGKLFPSKTGGATGCVRNWELGLNMPTNEQFNLICKTYNLPFESLEEAEREIIGLQEKAMSGWNMDGTTQFKDRDITKGTSEWEGWGTALKPAHEPICMARKPLSEKSVAENVLKYGTGGINIDESRVEYQGDADRASAMPGTTPHTSNKGKNAIVGGGIRPDHDLHNGRFPANLIHDNSEEVRECFPDSKSCNSPSNAKPKSKFRPGQGNYQPQGVIYPGESGNASRFFKSIIYQAKASKSERGKGNNHPTVKPIALMEYLINMVTRTGGTVLDPFMGSGSTGVACKNTNRKFIGIEKDGKYFEIAKERIEAT